MKSSALAAMSAPVFKNLDVRPLLAQGIEPLAEIRARLDALSAGQGLTVIAPFLPAPLIELLRSEGYSASIERRGEGWAAHFWRD
ncbi:MAG: DUF2249 domain-containing protein [Opitutaceae bacterium]|nr:DUF2249 domain-containing protein [Opitutaceae bacterium]